MNRADRLMHAAEAYIDRKQFSGIEWHVEAKGNTLTSGRTGLADPVSEAQIPEDAIYRIYSMTKPIISVMALMLMEQGKLRLYDALAQFNPAFSRMRVLLPDGSLQPAARPILVEDLMTHRSGFTYEFITGCHIAPGYDAIDLSADGKSSLDEMMAKLASQPLAFQPGSQFRYSVSTDALAHVIEKASGRTIGSLLKEYIFEPLGMTDTDYYVPADKQARLMPMFGVSDITKISSLDPPAEQILNPANVEEMYPSTDKNFARGGHGLYSTLMDYSKFARMLLDGTSPQGDVLLSRKMLSMMTANRIPESQRPLKIGMNPLPGYGWGLGVRVMTDIGQSLGLTGNGEFGWAGAASTYFWVDPEEEMTGVFMTQYLGSVLPLADDLRSAAYQMLP
ncbi:MAG: beta-lactamase family protein [Proteobacteria bacterium]|nr:beta-lactamase family protein [Pseudomonadota bacterium]